MKRWFVISAWAALFTFRVLPASGQTEGVDEFDAGDQWIDTDEDVGWYSTSGRLMWEDPGAFTLDLTAGHRTAFLEANRVSVLDDGLGSGSSRGEFYALATLQVPWEGLIARRTQRREAAQAPRSGPSLAAQDAGGSSAEEDDVEQNESVSPASDESTQQRVEPPTEPASKEPESSVPETDSSHALSSDLVLLVSRQIAAHVGGAEQAVDQRLQSLARRSRYSGLSPELRMRGVLGFDRTTSTQDSVGIYPGDTTTRGARDSLAEVRLTFRLDRLVLGDKEDSIERQRIQLVTNRRKMVAEAIDLFMQWRLSSVRATDESLPPDGRLRAQVQAETNLAQLHLLTGGWFQGERTLRELATDLPGKARPE